MLETPRRETRKGSGDQADALDRSRCVRRRDEPGPALQRNCAPECPQAAELRASSLALAALDLFVLIGARNGAGTRRGGASKMQQEV